MKLLPLCALVLACHLHHSEVVSGLPVSGQRPSDGGQTLAKVGLPNSKSKDDFDQQSLVDKNNKVGQNEAYDGETGQDEKIVIETNKPKPAIQSELKKADKATTLSEAVTGGQAPLNKGTGNRPLSRALTDAFKLFVDKNNKGQKQDPKSQGPSLSVERGLEASAQVDNKTGSSHANEAHFVYSALPGGDALPAALDSGVPLLENDMGKAGDKTAGDVILPKHDANASSNIIAKDEVVKENHKVLSVVDNPNKIQLSDGANLDKESPTHKDVAVNDQPVVPASKTPIQNEAHDTEKEIAVPSAAKTETGKSSVLVETMKDAQEQAAMSGAKNGTTSVNGGSSTLAAGHGSAATGLTTSTVSRKSVASDTSKTSSTLDMQNGKQIQNEANSSNDEISFFGDGENSFDGVRNSPKDEQSIPEEGGNIPDDVDYEDSDLNLSKEEGGALVAGEDAKVPVQDMSQGIEPINSGPIQKEEPGFSNEKLGEFGAQNVDFSNKVDELADGSAKEFNGDGYLPDAEANYHFGYLLLLTIFGALAYFLYLKRKKVLALLLEGRRSNNRRGSISRRPRSRSGGYSLLRSSGEVPQVSPDSKESSHHTTLERIY